jgi:NADH-quinone oxidoreductase subunit G
MCLVEVEKSPKPVASCAMPASEGMVVHTHSPLAKRARENTLEFLLINHPLDCPICDQAGACDLQDLTMAYGRGGSRFNHPKRAVKNKYMGPLINTVMTRCIHCTRCIRFANEIAGIPEIGTLGRGEHMEITTYLEGAITSELSGNLIDVCPVGALTSKPAAFQSRPWELKKTNSIDVMDATGANIRIDSRGGEVMGILPRLNKAINEEWISDKTRFAYDGLKYQRLDTPYIRMNGKLTAATWGEAFNHITQALARTQAHQRAALAGPLADNESLFLLRTLWDAMGSPHRDCRPTGLNIPHTHRSHYLFNTTIQGLEEADALLLIGTNPRYEAPLINARIYKTWQKRGLPVGLIGPKAALNYPYSHLGHTPKAFAQLTQADFATHLRNAAKPALIVGEGVFKRPDTPALLGSIQQLLERYAFIQEGWNGYNFLPTAAAQVGGLDLGFTPGPQGLDTAGIMNACQQGDITFVYLLGVDTPANWGEAFVVYQGHHGDAGAQQADVILPGLAYSEKTALYTNLEGRVQKSEAAVPPPGDAKEDWRIIRQLSATLGMPLPYDHQPAIWRAMEGIHPAYARIGLIAKAPWEPLATHAPGPLQEEPFTLTIPNFYMTDVISRHSPTMAACVREIQQEGPPA